jgi:malonate decarboxylase alpha subunit
MEAGFGGSDPVRSDKEPEAPHRAVLEPVRSAWRTRREDKARRLDLVAKVARGRVLPTEGIVPALEVLLAPGDRVAVEGDNQKQADFLSRSLAAVDPEKVHDLHMLISSISRPEQLDLFERGIATRVDFSYAGPQSLRVAQLLADGKLRVGAIHTYLELYARLFVDLVPSVALVAAESADAEGNLYTGSNTEDTPTIVEATAFRDGIVVAQVNELVDALPRVDVPGSWVDFVVVADRPYEVEPLFTRDPRQITEVQVLMAMLAIRGVYERHGVTSLNHGIGFGTAAIELLLPTYAESLGLRGKICRNWVLNPHPTLIPAIESGWVETVAAFGGEVGMEDYVAARPDVFMTGRDGSARSNRMAAQTAGLYGVDLFIGSTLQMDADANSSTVTQGRLAGFGGAPNLGSDARGRRHSSRAWLEMSTAEREISRGRKLVVQMVETFGPGGAPRFVETLDAVQVGADAGLPLAPVMVYGDDVTHVVTEEGVAYLYRARNPKERREALAAVAGVSPVGRRHDRSEEERLRKDGLVAFPEDLGVRRTDARRSLLAAQSIGDLVEWSGGLYRPPDQYWSP